MHLQVPRHLFVAAMILFVSALTAAAQDLTDTPMFHYTQGAYDNQTLSYAMVTTGSVAVTDAENPSHTFTFQIKADIDVVFNQRADDGSRSFSLFITGAESQGLDDRVGESLIDRGMQGVISPQGVILSMETPPVLAEIGLDLTDLFTGLIVPAPGGVATEGDTWKARFSRGNVGPRRARSLELTATYTAEGAQKWGSRRLSSVTARLRGDATLRQGSFRSQIQEIGHSLFYVQPTTGIVDMSSVSIVTLIDTSDPQDRGEIKTKVTLTTTLELRQSAVALQEPPALPENSGARAGQAIPGAQPNEESSPPYDNSGTPARQEPGADGSESDTHDPLNVPVPAKDPAPEETTPTGEEAAGVVPSAPADTPGTDTPGPVQPVAQPPHSPSHTAYRDPAGRFILDLPARWDPEPYQVTLRGTTFHGKEPGETAYVYVTPLASPAASALTVAKSALTTYQETQKDFTVLLEPQPDSIDGEAAYRALYQYATQDGRTVTEWGLFTRKKDRAFYLQYATPGEQPAEAYLPTFSALKDGFHFGPTPRGAVPVQNLTESLELYEDPAGRFHLLVPKVWPLVDRAGDGGTTTFTEIGEKGYLTVFAQTGARGVSAEQIVSAWKEQWSQEDGFELLLDVTPARLANDAGVRLDYRWSGGSGATWTRRLHGTVVGDYLFALALDHEGKEIPKRTEVFDTMVASFEILAVETPPERSAAGSENAPREEPTRPTPEPVAGTDREPDESPQESDEIPPTPPRETTPAPSEETEDIASSPLQERRLFAEPENAGSVLLLGRILTRYPGPDGDVIESWAKHADVIIFDGEQEYVGATDSLGYLFVDNLPPLSDGHLYTVARMEGPVLGFDQSVTVSFNNLQVGQDGPRIAHLRTLIITLNDDRTLAVDVVKIPPSTPDAPSALEYFVQEYPDSDWAALVHEVILSGRD